jgi:hypothetical protein
MLQIGYLSTMVFSNQSARPAERNLICHVSQN